MENLLILGTIPAKNAGNSRRTGKIGGTIGVAS
jgi:hypothetical protein